MFFIILGILLILGVTVLLPYIDYHTTVSSKKIKAVEFNELKAQLQEKYSLSKIVFQYSRNHRINLEIHSTSQLSKEKTEEIFMDCASLITNTKVLNEVKIQFMETTDLSNENDKDVLKNYDSNGYSHLTLAVLFLSKNPSSNNYEVYCYYKSVGRDNNSNYDLWTYSNNITKENKSFKLSDILLNIEK